MYGMAAQSKQPLYLAEVTYVYIRYDPLCVPRKMFQRRITASDVVLLMPIHVASRQNCHRDHATHLLTGN